MMATTQTNCEKPPVVTFLTRVVLSLKTDVSGNDLNLSGDCATAEGVRQMGQIMQERAQRVAAMMDFLATLGFKFSARKQTITAYSDKVEAGVVKKKLKNAGFADREFQIILEYTRGWGML